MYRHTNVAGWVASAGAGALTAASSPVGGSSLGAAILTVVLGGVGVVLGRVLWDITGWITARLRLRPQPVDCPLAASCPMINPPRERSHDLDAALGGVGGGGVGPSDGGVGGGGVGVGR